MGVLSPKLLCVFVVLILSATTSARRPGSGGGSSGSGGSGSGSGGSGSGSGGSGSGTGGSGSGSGGSGSGGSSIGGSGQHTYPPSNGWSGTSYRPPQQIQHGSNSFPISQVQPPVYVYQIRDSGSRYNNLLTGLALWNIGRRPSTVNQNNDNSQNAPDEVCKFRLRSNGTVEDRRIECRTISSFIWEWENPGNSTSAGSGAVGEVTVVENGGASANGTGVIDALDDKGDSILVSPGMTCYIIRILPVSTTTQQVDCELLQLYTANSWRNSGSRLAPALIIILAIQVLLFKIL